MIIQARAWCRCGVPVALYGRAAPRTGRPGPVPGRDSVDASARFSSWTIRASRCDSPTAELPAGKHGTSTGQAHQDAGGPASPVVKFAGTPADLPAWAAAGETVIVAGASFAVQSTVTLLPGGTSGRPLAATSPSAAAVSRSRPRVLADQRQYPGRRRPSRPNSGRAVPGDGRRLRMSARLIRFWVSRPVIRPGP
jgi:hypothetical protein